MSDTLPDAADPPRGLDPIVAGLLLSFLSAALYAITNVCLRSSVGQNDIWVTFFKTAPTALIAAALLGIERRRGARFQVPPSVLLALVVTGLVSQWCGNVAFQVGLRKIGLAVGPPITFGALMVGGAILGRVWLREAITLTTAIGIVTLIASIVLLQLGASAPSTTHVSLHPWTDIAQGVTVVCGAGFSYALLGAVIRWATIQRVPSNYSVMIVGLTGFLTLGAGSWWQLGSAGLWATPLRELIVMLAAGVCNTLAFLCLARSLQLAPVSQINAVNSSQVAMSSVAGVVLFAEPASWHLVAGIGTMIVGLWLMNRR